MHTASEHDVIVVGAGPGGATTAAALARRGRDVLMLDRSAFPRDKICGDAIAAGAVHILNELGAGEKIQAAEARGEFYRLHGMRLISPSGHLIRAPFHKGEGDEESYIAPRIYFDALVQQQAVDCGAHFVQAEVKEPLMEDGRVVGVLARENGTLREYRARAVVGADGVTSAIMRHLRPESGQHVDRHRAVALRAYVEDIDLYPHEVEFFLYDDILPGYAWIFPAGDSTANIGLGMRLDVFRGMKKNLKKLLQEFLALPAISERLKRGGVVHDVATWQLNFGSQRKLQHAFDGALLVGDAAGFINPLTGGGIHNALISGVLAAETIDGALNNGDVSREALIVYEQRCKDEMWSGMRKSYLYQLMLMNYPGFVDRGIRFLGGHRGVADIFVSKL